MVGGDDEMLGDRDHVVAPPVRALHHPSLVGSGDGGLPGLRNRLEAQQVRNGEGEFHGRPSQRSMSSNLGCGVVNLAT